MPASDFCQRCKLPLLIDNSLENLTRAQANLLIASRTGYGKGDGPAGEAPGAPVEAGDEPFVAPDRLDLFRRVSAQNSGAEPVIRQVADSSDSFVILPQFRGDEGAAGDPGSASGEPEDDPDKHLSSRVTTLTRIFSILSSKNEIDYPVCKDCSQLLLSNLKTQYDKTLRERDIYIQFLDKLQTKQAPYIKKSEDSIKEVDRLNQEEQKLLAELQSLEREHDDLNREIDSVEAEIAQIDKQEQEILIKENLKSLEIGSFFNQRDKLLAELNFNTDQLNKLRKTNVLNDTFNISHDGPFGTINGLRLGNIEKCLVPWQEINAALGQVVLLLATVTKRLNFKLTGYRLRPMGSTSRIDRIEPASNKVTTLDVFSSGEYQFERMFISSKFDQAMIAIVDIMRQIVANFESTSSSSAGGEALTVPYKMSGNYIENESILLSSKVCSNEWTTACKFLLTNLKWILAYTSAHSAGSAAGVSH